MGLANLKMEFLKKINIIKDFLLDLIFPKICLSCNKEGSYLCEKCLVKIPLVDKLGCPVCGKITLYGKTCDDCRRKTYLTGLLYATSYKNPIIREAIKLLKYKYVKELSEALAKIMLRFIKNSGFLVNNFTDELSSFLIIPVPLHRKKFLSRGFNQSELLAQKLAEELEMEMRTDILIKIKNTRSQTDLKEKERVTNVKDVFAVKNKKETRGKIILLIDDVTTTGSTLNEAAKVLKKSGSREVWGITLARG